LFGHGEEVSVGEAVSVEDFHRYPGDARSVQTLATEVSEVALLVGWDPS